MKSFCQGLANWLGGNPNAATLPALGEREVEVLKLLWSQGELTAQQVLNQISAGQPSLSTMQSTLERLNRKELVSRVKCGRSYRYKATLSQSDIISRLMGEIASQLGNGRSDIMVSGFMSYMEANGGAPASEKTSQELNKLQRNK